MTDLRRAGKIRNFGTEYRLGHYVTEQPSMGIAWRQHVELVTERSVHPRGRDVTHSHEHGRLTAGQRLIRPIFGGYNGDPIQGGRPIWYLEALAA